MERFIKMASLAWVLGAGVYLLAGAKFDSRVSRTDVDLDQVTTAPNMKIYSFNIPIPPGDYSANVWLERWTRDSSEPKVYCLDTTGMIRAGKLTISLPTLANPNTMVSWKSNNPAHFSGAGGRSELKRPDDEHVSLSSRSGG